MDPIPVRPPTSAVLAHVERCNDVHVYTFARRCYVYGHRPADTRLSCPAIEFSRIFRESGPRFRERQSGKAAGYAIRAKLARRHLRSLEIGLTHVIDFISLSAIRDTPRGRVRPILGHGYYFGIESSFDKSNVFTQRRNVNTASVKQIASLIFNFVAMAVTLSATCCSSILSPLPFFSSLFLPSSLSHTHFLSLSLCCSICFFCSSQIKLPF